MSLPNSFDQEPASPPACAWSVAQRIAIAGEMRLLLECPTFKSSKRCVALLSWLVEYSLAGNQVAPKERTIGIAVFRRLNDYDTNTDPIVRMTANEVRKRLAMYYEDPDCRMRSTVRIRLAPGAYGLEFDFRRSSHAALSDHAPVLDAESSESAHATPNAEFPQPLATQPAEEPLPHSDSYFEILRRRFSLSGLRLALIALALLLSLAVSLFAFTSGSLRSVQFLAWKPLLSSGTPPIICISDDSTVLSSSHGIVKEIPTEPPATHTSVESSASLPLYSFSDINVAHKVSLYLARYGKETTLRQPHEIGLWEFHHQPVVLIGSGVGMWPTIFLSRLRFTTQMDQTTGLLHIHDSQHPNNLDWTLASASGKRATVDYGIVTRIFNEDTGNWLFCINGLGQSGTEAAAQLLTDSSLIKDLPRQVRSSRNFQIVVRASVIDGKTGIPRIISYDAW